MIAATCAALAPLLARCEAHLVNVLALALPALLVLLVVLAAALDRLRRR